MANLEVKTLFAAVFLSALCACSKQHAENVKISAMLPEGNSKVAFERPEQGDGLALRWEAGDRLAVIGGNTSVFTICDGFTGHSAEFEGSPVSGTSFSVLYPGSEYSTEQSILGRSYLGQVQDGNASTSHLKWTAMLGGIADYTHADFSAGRRSGVLAVSAVLPEEVTEVRRLVISARTPVFYTTNDPASPKVTDMELELRNVDLSADHTLYSYMMTSWEDMYLPYGEVLTVQIVVNPELRYTKRLTVPAGGLTVRAGMVNVIRLYGDTASSNMSSNLENFIWTDDNFWN